MFEQCGNIARLRVALFESAEDKRVAARMREPLQFAENRAEKRVFKIQHDDAERARRRAAQLPRARVWNVAEPRGLVANPFDRRDGNADGFRRAGQRARNQRDGNAELCRDVFLRNADRWLMKLA